MFGHGGVVLVLLLLLCSPYRYASFSRVRPIDRTVQNPLRHLSSLIRVAAPDSREPPSFALPALLSTLGVSWVR